MAKKKNIETTNDEVVPTVTETKPKKKGFKISKVILNPSRKINLGNYETLDLNAGVEITFDSPIESNSEAMKSALDEMRKFIRNEFNEQFKAFKGGEKNGKSQSK